MAVQLPPFVPTMGGVGMAVLVGAMAVVALLILRRRSDHPDGS